MQTVTFACQHCNNLMAATTDLLGQQVHCPTCGNVVVAPSAAMAPALVPESTTDLAPELFEVPKQEAPDSIFGDAQDEDALGMGEKTPQVEIPEDPAPSVPNANSSELAAAPNSTATVAPPVSLDLSPPQSVWSAPATTKDEPQLAPSSPASEPWQPRRADSETPSEHWQPAAPHADGDGPMGEPVRFRRPEETRERQKSRTVLLAILAPYSVIMTIIAIMYFVRYRNYEADHDPLERIPDLIRLIKEPIKKNQTVTIKNMPSPDGTLTDRLKVKMDSTISVGELEITPTRIEQGRIKVYAETKNGREGPIVNSREALTLHLKIRNRSRNLSICPTDPMFDRRFNPEFSLSKPYTLIEVADRKFYGGAIDHLNMEARVQRAYIEGQEHDDTPLPPGESRDVVTCSDPQRPELLSAVSSFNGTMVWRVQIRHSLVAFHGEQVPLTGVVGVEFTANDIKKVAKN